MIIRLAFKTPDVGYHALRDMMEHPDYEEAKEAIEKFVKCDEYIYIDIDTKKGTATVVPVGR